VALLSAAQSAHSATANPDGFVFFVNGFGQPVDLTVDGEKVPDIQNMKVVSYPVVRGEHDIQVAAGTYSAILRRSLQLETVAQDGKGRSYWCFATAPNTDGAIKLIELDSAFCAKLIWAVEMDNR
jgi:hypothetical protein